MIIIIGAGHGGVQAAASLRENGFEGQIMLISEEVELPYQKPPLSKGYLQGKQSEEAILFRSPNYYDNNNIDLRLGVKVEQILPDENAILTQNGEKKTYSHLILATGANNRQLVLEGSAPSDFLYLRTLADAKIIKEKLPAAQHIVVIGGGFIGLELAALCVEKGKNVSVIEAQSRLMERVLPSVISDVFYNTHIENGVQLFLNAKIECLEKEKDSKYVLLKDGNKLKADLILVGIGVNPADELAKNAGIECENGIKVNEFQQTSIPNIYAIGDCANHFNAFAKRNVRLESVQNALEQAKTAVFHILNNPQPYHVAPWFWTNQFHLKLQMAGISTDYDEFILKGDIDKPKFSVYYFKNNTLIAVDSLNAPADHLNARKLLMKNEEELMKDMLDFL